MDDVKFTISFWDRKLHPDFPDREAIATSLSVANLPAGTVRAMRPGGGGRGHFLLEAGPDHAYAVFPLGESFTLTKLAKDRIEDVGSVTTPDLASGLDAPDFEAIAEILSKAMARADQPRILDADKAGHDLVNEFAIQKYTIEIGREHAHGAEAYAPPGGKLTLGLARPASLQVARATISG